MSIRSINGTPEEVVPVPGVNDSSVHDSSLHTGDWEYPHIRFKLTSNPTLCGLALHKMQFSINIQLVVIFY